MEKFAELQYTRPDYEQVQAQLLEALETFKQAESYEEARKAFFARQEILSEFQTMATIASIRSDINTLDAYYQEERKYLNEVSPKIAVTNKLWNEAFVAGTFRAQFEEEFGTLIFDTMEADIRTNGEEITELAIRESELSTKYAHIAAGCKTVFEGEECNFYGLLKHMLSLDRDHRKRAMKAWSALYESVSEELDETYTELSNIRREEAKRLGFNSYIDMVYLVRHRLDYTAEDIAKFREFIRKYVVPAAQKIHDAQAKRLGIDALHYYDEPLYFKDGNATPTGTTQEKIAAGQKMYSELSPETKEFFDFMVEHDLFDLETRPGKHLGGYMTSLGKYKAPFIFSNFNGTSADLQVLIHEAGHAFEGYTAMRCQELREYMHSTADINEIHSMSMEFFTDHWYDLFFEEGKSDKYRYEHLADSLQNLTYLVSVDAFQHKVFEGEQPDGLGLRKIWKEVETEMMPWRNYDGNAFLDNGGYWMQKQHIFLYPFYYVDYALSMICAMQFYLRMRQDYQGAWQDYYKLCRLAGSLGYKDLLKAANLKSPFEEETVKEVTEGVMAILAEMEEKM